MAFIDAKPSAGAVRVYDVCVIGSGPAGMSVALRLASTGKRIALIEAGGSTPKPQEGPASPFSGRVSGLDYDLLNSRLRGFGGTTGHWGGACRPLDKVDFRPRSFPGGLAGWPISREDLEPYFLEASRWLDIDPAVFEVEGFDGAKPYADQFFDHFDSRFRTRLKRHSSPPVRFGERYRPTIGDLQNVDCYLNAVVFRLEENKGRIERVQINAQGSTFFIEAGLVVLAAGGIESPRLLLASADEHSRGVSNDSGFVGRCFGDHIVVYGAYLRASVPVPHRFEIVDNELILFGLSFSDQFLRENDYPNFSLIAEPHEEVGFQKFIDDSYMQKIVTLDGGKQVDSEFMILSILAETTPNPESRITLTDQRDAFGMPRVDLNWKMNQGDFDAIGEIFRQAALILGERGRGRVRVYYRDTEDLRRRAHRQSHHMGTLRMSLDPGKGVVDSNCRSHEVENLFVAGNAVFPAYGYTNPTLNILALSLRLADHIAEQVL